MQRITTMCSAIALTLGGAGVATVVAQDDAPDMAAMMEMMAEMGAPDENHALLEPMVGTFQADGVFYMGPGPEQWSGTATNEWVLGGRFLHGTFEIPEMAGGPDFHGIAYTGYNKLTGEYESVWLDSMSTSMFMETGTYDPETKSFHFKGVQTDPMTGEKKPSRSVITLETTDRHIAKMYSVGPDGEEHLDMEIVYTRK